MKIPALCVDTKHMKRSKAARTWPCWLGFVSNTNPESEIEPRCTHEPGVGNRLERCMLIKCLHDRHLCNMRLLPVYGHEQAMQATYSRTWHICPSKWEFVCCGKLAGDATCTEKSASHCTHVKGQMVIGFKCLSGNRRNTKSSHPKTAKICKQNFGGFIFQIELKLRFFPVPFLRHGFEVLEKTRIFAFRRNDGGIIMENVRTRCAQLFKSTCWHKWTTVGSPLERCIDSENKTHKEKLVENNVFS